MSIKETSGNAATVTAIGSGAVGWVNEHYLVLWLGISAFSAVTALVFYILNYLENKKQTNHLVNGTPSE